MASVPIKVPGVGESISEGIVARWLKPDGAAVKAGEPLFELETDKASNVVPAEKDGVLKIGVPEGTTVAIGAVVGTLDSEATPSAAAPTPAPKAEAPAQAQAQAGARAPAAASSDGGRTEALSPAVRRLAA